MKNAQNPLILLLLLILLGNLLDLPMASAGTKGRVSVTEAGFVSPDYQQTQRKDFQFIGAGLDTLTQADKEEEIENSLQGQIRGMVAPGATVLSYLNVSQLFWKQNALSVGRKKINWSLLDEDFQLGLYQPLFKWNPLQTESQGLTGVFLMLGSEPENKETIPWGLTLFGSPMFIPDQGPGYEIKDGQFEASNPYFQNVPKQAQVFGETVPLKYNVQKPQTDSVIFNNSFAGRAHIGNERRGFYGQVSYANKPANQLALGFDTYLNINPNANLAEVEILPAIYFHQVTSADVKWMGKNFGVGISGLHETPSAPKYKEEWTYVVYKESNLVSPFIQLRGYGIDAKLAYISIAGGESEAIGKFANQSDQFLPQRYPFQNAGVASVTYRYRLKKDSGIGIGTRYLQGEKSEFALWSSHLYYQWEERWAMNLQGQMLAVEDSVAGRKTGYWPFVNNDSVSMGVQYVF